MPDAAAPGLSRRRRAWRVLGWSIAAVAAPLAGAFACRLLQQSGLLRGPLAETLGIGGLAGMIVGLAAGVRSGRLLAWTLGPPLGFLAGFLDLAFYSWLCALGCPPFRASLAPVWGTTLGLAAGLPHRRILPILALTLGAAAAQSAANAAWFAFATSSWAKAGGVASARWLLESLVYAPPALIVVLGIPRRSDDPPHPKK